MDICDVVVIGGGLAGLTAARELQSAGLRTVVVEARDRLGGRTWTEQYESKSVELGGAWVHWHQPHVWAELNRYGLTLVESGVAAGSSPRSHVFAGIDLGRRRSLGSSAESVLAKASWIVDGELRTGDVN